MRIRILPYKQGSRSARVLAREMGALRLNLTRIRFRPRPSDLIINWGNRNDLYPGARYINHPDAVAVAQCKLATLIRLRDAGVPHPQFTADPEVALGWLSDSMPVVARTLLRGSAARGLVLVHPGDDLPVAPLYTLYTKKRTEYRIHVMLRGEAYEVLDIQEKRRRSGGESDSQIRNAARGWVYCREGVAAPEGAIVAALDAVRATGLHFGAVDLGWNRHYEQSCVYEVNTAPGLDGTTPARYAAGLYSYARSG
jgi:glutathione synthase/RimK-type ligase-like ATP-grasp enzyme